MVSLSLLSCPHHSLFYQLFYYLWTKAGRLFVSDALLVIQPTYNKFSLVYLALLSVMPWMYFCIHTSKTLTQSYTHIRTILIENLLQVYVFGVSFFPSFLDLRPVWVVYVYFFVSMSITVSAVVQLTAWSECQNDLVCQGAIKASHTYLLKLEM